MEKEMKKKSPISIASFVLGIISILTAFFWYMVLPTGILAVVFGAKGVRKTGNKLGKAGLILGIIGLSLFAFVYVGLVLILVMSI